MAVLALVLLLSACEVRLYADLAIEEDESGTIAVEMAYNDVLAMMVGSEVGDELEGIANQVPAGWQAETFAEDGFNGVRITVPFQSFAELQTVLTDLTRGEPGSDLPVGEMVGFIDGISLTREGDTFRFSLAMPSGIAQALTEELGPAPFDLSTLDSVFDIRMSLTLPGEIVSHNADIEVGETLVWNLSWFTESARTLEAESMISSGGLGALWVVLALVVLVALVVLLLVNRPRTTPNGADLEPFLDQQVIPEQVMPPAATLSDDPNEADPEPVLDEDETGLH